LNRAISFIGGVVVLNIMAGLSITASLK